MYDSNPSAAAEPNEPFASRIAAATATLRLDDGRALAYCEFGEPDGEPVMVFHGGIGSRGFGLLFDEVGQSTGVRIVSPDRPGFGRSSPQPDRRLRDWPGDVLALADELGIDRFGVLGVSGGGPYAAACSALLPDRLTATALVSSLGPPEGPRPHGLKVLGWLARWTPWLAGVPLKRTIERARTDPHAAMLARARGKAEPEQRLHRSRPGEILTAQTTEAGRQGHRHAVREIAIVMGPWGFELGDLRGRIGLWHGALDRTIPVTVAEYLADATPAAELTVHDDVGHLSLPVEYAEEILTFVADLEARTGIDRDCA